MEEITKAIGRLRRTQGRNPDTMLLCDAYEKLWQQYKLIANEKMRQVEIVNKTDCPTCEANKAANLRRVRKFRNKEKTNASA